MDDIFEYFVKKDPDWNLIADGLLISTIAFCAYILYETRFNNRSIFLNEKENNHE